MLSPPAVNTLLVSVTQPNDPVFPPNNNATVRAPRCVARAHLLPAHRTSRSRSWTGPSIRRTTVWCAIARSLSDRSSIEITGHLARRCSHYGRRRHRPLPRGDFHTLSCTPLPRTLPSVCTHACVLSRTTLRVSRLWRSSPIGSAFPYRAY